MTKTMSIRMDRDNYEFLTAITKQRTAIYQRRCAIW